ncbi:hypothetical protein D3C77_646650 [compost metagenome]
MTTAINTARGPLIKNSHCQPDSSNMPFMFSIIQPQSGPPMMLLTGIPQTSSAVIFGRWLVGIHSVR